MLITALSFIFVLGVLVFIHELGHFLVAKKVGIKVEKFSLGFPPNIFSKKYGETTYCIGIIPLGGYVKMLGENPDDELTGDPREFMAKSVGQRVAVIFAGPFMNYVLAILLMVGIFYFGGQPLFDPDRIIVGEVVEGDPAFQAGLQSDDVIVAIDGEAVNNFDSLRTRINAKVIEPINLAWIHEGDTVTAIMTTKAGQVPNIDGGVDSIGLIGFSEKVIGYQQFGFFESVGQGFVKTHLIVYTTVVFIKMLVSGEVSSKLIGGPIFIAQQSGREAQKGASSLFFFMALLSVNLAVLNILPIPILDGGHLVFLAVEKIKGSPLSMRARGVAQQVGMVFLLSLIVFVTYNDILRVIKSF
jgi:regulator of sigma E protease